VQRAQGSIRIAPLITSPMTMLVQNNHDRSLSLMAATTRNTLSTNHAPIITSSVRMDRQRLSHVQMRLVIRGILATSMCVLQGVNLSLRANWRSRQEAVRR
jgi:hypothetical protein